MKVIERVERNFWEDVAGNCSYATFFHTPYWAELMSKTYSYIDITKGFTFDNGARAVFPFMCRKISRLKGALHLYDYVSGPTYVYGGPISDSELSNQQLDEIIEYIKSTFKTYNTILIRGNPFGPDIKPDGFQEVKDSSHVVELSRFENERDLLINYGKSTRRKINKAKRSNMLVIKEANTIDEFETLYNIYQKTMKYWEKPLTNHPLILFQNYYSLKSKYIKLWTVYYKNNMIGGDLMIFWKDFCFNMHSYHDREYSKLYSRRYLLYNLFLDCKEKGIRYFDFMQSGGIKGVEFFKRSMGGEEYPHRAWLKETRLLKKMSGIKGDITSIYKKGRLERD